MVTISLRVAPGSAANMDAAFQHIEKIAEFFHVQVVDTALETWETEVKQIFSMEGSPAWVPLRPMTVGHRIILGYGPKHPILKRKGILLHGLWDPFFPAQIREVDDVGPKATPIQVPKMTGSVFDSQQPMRGHDIFSLGTADERFLPLHEGTTKIPPRPMVPHTPGQKHGLGMKIEARLVPLMDKAAMP